MASEEMSFENVERRMDDDDGWRASAYTISSPLSIRLRWAKNCIKLTGEIIQNTLTLNSGKIFDLLQAFGPHVSFLYYFILVLCILDRKLKTIFFFLEKGISLAFDFPRQNSLFKISFGRWFYISEPIFTIFCGTFQDKKSTKYWYDITGVKMFHSMMIHVKHASKRCRKASSPECALTVPLDIAYLFSQLHVNIQKHVSHVTPSPIVRLRCQV